MGVLAGKDHTAVDDPGGDRGKLPGRDCNHRFIEQPQAVLDASEPDQDVPVLVGRKCKKVGVAEAFADGCGLAGGSGGSV